MIAIHANAQGIPGIYLALHPLVARLGGRVVLEPLGKVILGAHIDTECRKPGAQCEHSDEPAVQQMMGDLFPYQSTKHENRLSVQVQAVNKSFVLPALPYLRSYRSIRIQAAAKKTTPHPASTPTSTSAVRKSEEGQSST